MGLIEILFIFTGIYWISYLISLFVTASFDYKHLKLPLRITLGFIYFSFANAIFFKIFSIQVSVFLSIFLLLGISFIKNKNFLPDSFLLFKNSRKSSVIYFSLYLFLLNVFILPMHISKHYTAFTEKGGDITIYSDISKFLVDHKEPAFGLQDGIADFTNLVTDPLYTILDNMKDYRDVELLDPPSAEYASYRVIATKWYTSSQIVLNAEWFFLSGNISLIFYVLLAFIYASIIALFFAYTLDLGLTTVILYTALLIVSPSLISVFYNLYLMHVFSLLCIIFAFSLILKGKFNSFNTHFDLLIILLFLFSCYYMILLVIIIPYFFFIVSNYQNIRISKFKFVQFESKWRLFIFSFIFLVIVSWICLDIFGTSVKKIVAYVIALMYPQGMDGKHMETYLGKAIPILTEKWFSFFSGLMSQDHFPPFFPKIEFLDSVAKVNFYSFSCFIILSIVNFVRSILKKTISRKLVVFNLSILFTIILYTMIAKGYLYMQSKAAQYNLIPVYFSLLLLNQQLIKSSLNTFWDKFFKIAVLILFSIQIVVFSIPRYLFLISVSNSTNLSCVMEKSFYEQTKNISTDSLTLIELEKPGCIYFITQPFFGKKMVPTKHLSLNRVNVFLENGVYNYTNLVRDLNASDFVEVDSSKQSIIYLYPEKIIKKEIKYLGFKTEVVWGKKNMKEIKSPELVLTADLFEKNYGTTTIEGKTKKVHYSRNGAGLLFFPDSKKDQLVTVEYKNAREETKTTVKAENLKFKSKSNFVESIGFVDNPKYLQVKFKLKESKNPFFLHLPKLDQEYLISVETLDQSL
jgi:hypothetical protein